MTTNPFVAFSMNTGRGDGDQVIYYRRSRDAAENPGWITWADSLSGTKLRDMAIRGYEPLFKYGVINSKANVARGLGPMASPPGSIWDIILSHPDGPEEFPIDQVITYRWYRPEECPLPDIYFPQLMGKRIAEYRCPECRGRKPFVDIDGGEGVTALAIHLRIMHSWDRPSIMLYGDRVGIDFQKVNDQAGLVNTYEVAAIPEPGTRQRRAAAASGEPSEAGETPRQGRGRRGPVQVDVETHG